MITQEQMWRFATGKRALGCSSCRRMAFSGTLRPFTSIRDNKSDQLTRRNDATPQKTFDQLHTEL